MGLIGSHNDEFHSHEGSGIKLVDADGVTFGWRSLAPTLFDAAAGMFASGATLIAGGSSGNWCVFDMEKALQHSVAFAFVLPQDYVPGTDIQLRALWCDSNAAPAGAVYWSAYATAAHGFAPQGSDSNAQTLEYNAPQAGLTANPTVPNEQFKLCATDFAFSDWSGGVALLAPGALVVGRLTRLVGDPLDTSTDDVELAGVVLLYQSTNLATKNTTPDFYA